MSEADATRETQHAQHAQGSQGGVQSVARALDLLETLADADTAMPLADIADRAKLSAPTAHRLLKTLQQRGYVHQGPDRQYSLGPGLIRLGQQATPRLALQAQSVLADLEQTAEETANLAVLDGDLVAYIAQVPSRHRMRMFTEVGRRVLPHASGVGKAMLSVLPDRDITALIRRTGLPQYTPSTHTSERSLLADLHESRRRGFAIDDGEQEIGVRCIAVALPGVHPPVAVSISGPAARVTDAKSAGLVDALQLAARTLAQRV